MTDNANPLQDMCGVGMQMCCSGFLDYYNPDFGNFGYKACQDSHQTGGTLDQSFCDRLSLTYPKAVVPGAICSEYNYGMLGNSWWVTSTACLKCGIIWWGHARSTLCNGKQKQDFYLLLASLSSKLNFTWRTRNNPVKFAWWSLSTLILQNVGGIGGRLWLRLDMFLLKFKGKTQVA